MSQSPVSASAQTAARPTVLVVDMYRMLSDTDHLELMVLLGCQAFDLKAVVVDVHRPELALFPDEDNVAYVRRFLQILGRPDIPVAAGSRETLAQAGQPGDTEAEGVRLLRNALREHSGLLVLCWAGLTDLMLAWNASNEAIRANLWRAYGVLGWFDRRIHPGRIQQGQPPLQGTPTRIQDDTNVGYDPLAFVQAVNGDLPFVWSPVGYSKWLWLDAQEAIRRCRKEISVWLGRELFFFHLVRELAARQAGGPARFFLTHQDHRMGLEPPPQPERIDNPARFLRGLDREELASRPIKMWETAATHHAACASLGQTCASSRETRYRLRLEWEQGWPALAERAPAPDGIRVLTDIDARALEDFAAKSLLAFT